MTDKDIVVAPLRIAHVAAVAELHCRALGGLLAALGPRAARAFYRGYVESPRCVAFVAEERGVLRGFVLGSWDPGALRRDALRARGVRMLGAVLASVLRRPSLLRDLLDGRASLHDGRLDPRAPELTYVAVRAEARGAGVGSALLAAFGDALRARQISRYELSVEADNAAAVAFYRSNGLVQIGTYRQFGKAYGRYAMQLGA